MEQGSERKVIRKGGNEERMDEGKRRGLKLGNRTEGWRDGQKDK